MNGEAMIRRIEELVRANEAKEKYIKQLELQIERLKPPSRGRAESSTRLERLLDKVNKKPR